MAGLSSADLGSWFGLDISNVGSFGDSTKPNLGSWAGQSIPTGSGEELGYTTIGSSEGAGRGRSIEITTTGSGLLVSYGYVYTNNTSGTDADISMAIFTTVGSQVGACSNETTVPTGTVSGTWFEVTWSSSVSLSASTAYRIQFYTSDGSEIGYFYDETGSNNAFSNNSLDRCPHFLDTSSTRRATMSVANYNAH